MKKSGFRILVVDDDIAYADTCAKVIAGAGFDVLAVGSSADALAQVDSTTPIGLVLTDLKMPGADGLHLLRSVKQRDPDVEVIVMTGYASIESAVNAIKEKAFDYITKPFDKDDLLNAVTRVFETWSLRHEVLHLRGILDGRFHFDGFVFKSEAMAVVYDRVRSAARCDCSVLITGESGTGKEVMAHAIHSNSVRSNGPFIAVNCGALSAELIESELFGYRKGAFTGADHDHPGLFRAADGGTLFLDEIVEMKASTQSKLLRCIQEHAVRPVGSVTETRVDVRFIAATNADVRSALSSRQLREDLYHRLNVITVEIPPLRRLREEIPELLSYLMDIGQQTHSHSLERIDARAMARLKEYHWPGNIREAENFVERLFVTLHKPIVEVRDLPPHILSSTKSSVGKSAATEEEVVPSLSDAERDLVVRALHAAKGNKSKAAEILGISRPRLYKMIKSYGLTDL